MKNIEFYRNELSKYNYFDDAYNFAEKNGMKKEFRCSAWSDIYNWLLEEYQILDDAEKNFLSNVIKQLKTDKTKIVKRIYNCHTYGTEYECIEICYLKDEASKKCEIYLPFFKAGTMYKGMALGKEYSPEELGL